MRSTIGGIESGVVGTFRPLRIRRFLRWDDVDGKYPRPSQTSALPAGYEGAKNEPFIEWDETALRTFEELV